MGAGQLDLDFFPSAFREEASGRFGETESFVTEAGQVMTLTPRYEDLWMAHPTRVDNLSRIAASELGPSTTPVEFVFGSNESVLLRGQKTGNFLTYLEMRICLLPSFALDPAEFDIYKNLGTVLPVAFQLGVRLRNELGLSAITRQGVSVEFEDLERFKRIVLNSTTWKRCESFWRGGTIDI